MVYIGSLTPTLMSHQFISPNRAKSLSYRQLESWRMTTRYPANAHEATYEATYLAHDLARASFQAGGTIVAADSTLHLHDHYWRSSMCAMAA